MKYQPLIKEALEALLNQIIINTDFGICNNISEFVRNRDIVVSPRYFCTSDIYTWMIDCYNTWEHYSGNPSYPILGGIESRDSYNCYNFHQSNDTLWVGKQLEYRLSLVQHLLNNIDKLEL